jgi:hypothetical protein
VPARFPGAPEIVETSRSHEPPDFFSLIEGSDVGVELYGGACSLRLDGRRLRVYVARFESASFSSYEEVRYAFSQLWHEVESLESPGEVREAARRWLENV